MGLINRLGTIVRLPDGRVGTTVYNGLDGVGIKWGRHRPPADLFEGSTGGVLDDPQFVKDRLTEWGPDAMLRSPYASAEIPCVGEDYEIIYPKREYANRDDPHHPD